MRRSPAQFVPKHLTLYQTIFEWTCCDVDKSYWKNCDDNASWSWEYDLGIKPQSNEWKVKSFIKKMLIVFLKRNELLHKSKDFTYKFWKGWLHKDFVRRCLDLWDFGGNQWYSMVK